jgi:outer membrane protein
MPSSLTAFLLGFTALGLVDTTWAQTEQSTSTEASAPAVADDDFRYLLGINVSSGPDYWGAARNSTGIKPLWAVRWGKWRLSTSGSAALMGFGNELPATGPGAGATRDLFRSDKLRVGYGLRLDNGRSSDNSDITAGLPDVKKTLRGRVYGSYAMAPRWQVSGAFSQDLLDRQGGASFDVGLSNQVFRSASSELTVGLSLAGGDGRHMNSYFGVPADSPAAARFGQAFVPSGGLRELGFSLGYTRAFSARWVGFSGVSVSRLLGPAAASPITQRLGNHSWNLGLAYRN